MRLTTALMMFIGMFTLGPILLPTTNLGVTGEMWCGGSGFVFLFLNCMYYSLKEDIRDDDNGLFIILCGIGAAYCISGFFGGAIFASANPIWAVVVIDALAIMIMIPLHQEFLLYWEPVLSVKEQI